jgi:serine/threonine-protein kinase
MIARFQREAKAAAALRSPHVVGIIDHALWDGVPFIAMELLDGENLGDRLARVGRLGVPETVRVLGEVCRALTKAHALGIVHRDLKPDNIFIVKDDDREITKVLDFGIAKTSQLETGSNTRTGAMLGTPYYMSPEQAQGVRAVDFRADLWSMAVIAYQCLTGQLPFESQALGDLLMKIMVAPLPVPSEIATVPPGFDAWWVKAASREAMQRFGSAKEFIDTLTSALEAMPQSARSFESSPALSTVSEGSNPRPATGSSPDFAKGTQVLGNTPRPDVRPMQNTPAPQAAQAPALGDSSSGRGQFAMTPSPTTQKFAETSPSKKGVAVAGAVGGGVVLLVVVGVLASRMLGSHAPATHDGAGAGVGVTPSNAAAPAPSPTTAAETAPTAASPTPSAAETASAAVTTSDSPPSGGPQGHAAAHGQPAGAASRESGRAVDKAKGAPSAAQGTTRPTASAAGSARRDFGF